MVISTANAGIVKLRVPGVEEQTIALHCVEPTKAGTEAVLFIHGLSFPTMLAAGFEFHGKDSWLHFMAARGFLACGMDFLGFGASSRPAVMHADPTGVAPMGKAADAAGQISVSVDYLLKKRGARRLHVVAHSWGTIPAALYAATHPATLDSLTLFGPVVPKPGSTAASTDVSWWSISAEERYAQLQFKEVLPPGVHLLEAEVDRRWAAEFAASEPQPKSKSADLRIPAGPLSDLQDAQADHYPYQPEDIQIPVLAVYGNYDNVVDDAGAETFLSRFKRSPLKWRLRIDDGTHVLHLERNRISLYQSVFAFIATVDGTGMREVRSPERM
jgi:pimeloyl-ACP methyl ester carboxylesterase